MSAKATVLEDMDLKSLSIQEGTPPPKSEVEPSTEPAATLPQDDTSSDTDETQYCNKCQANANLWCPSCAYSEERAYLARAFYCSRKCQRADWNNHKGYCRWIVNVNHLYRTVKAVQQVFYAFRRNLFDIQIKSISVTDKKIVIAEEKYDESINVPFPDDLIKDPLDKEAILSYLCCDDAVAWMHGLLEKLLVGTYKQVVEVVVDLKNNAREVLIPGKLDGAYTPVPGEKPEHCYHKVLKITMNAHMSYAVDIAGAQFGFHDPVIPWYEFERTRVSRVSKTLKFGASERVLSCLPDDVIASIDKNPVRYAIWGNQKMVVKHLNATFDSWAAESFNPAALANLGKRKHEKLMMDMVDVLASAMKAYVVTASKTKGFIVAVKGYPNGRKICFHGDGSTKDVKELHKELSAPVHMMRLGGPEGAVNLASFLDEYMERNKSK